MTLYMYSVTYYSDEGGGRNIIDEVVAEHEDEMREILQGGYYYVGNIEIMSVYPASEQQIEEYKNGY